MVFVFFRTQAYDIILLGTAIIYQVTNTRRADGQQRLILRVCARHTGALQHNRTH